LRASFDTKALWDLICQLEYKRFRTYRDLFYRQGSSVILPWAMPGLRFLPINFEQHSDLCINFRADSFKCSFNTDKHFWARYGEKGQKYLEILQSDGWLISFHVWEDNQIIGQIELGIQDEESHRGHVNLFYLIPEKRGQGYGKLLNTKALEILKNKGAVKATLTVSPINYSAIKFYEKHGWKNLGQNAAEARNSTSGLSVFYFEKNLINP